MVGAVDDHDGLVVVRVLDVKRLAGFLYGEVSGIGVEIVIVEVPNHGGPCVVQHPLNDAGGDVLIFGVGLEHSALGVVRHGLRHTLVVSRRRGRGVDGAHRVVEDFEGFEFAAAVVEGPVGRGRPCFGIGQEFFAAGE